MEKVVIFGTGARAGKALKSMEYDRYEIIAYVDNNPVLHGTLHEGVKVIAPQELETIGFDIIMICSTAFTVIYKQLTEGLGISKSKIENHLYFIKRKLIRYYQNLRNNQEIEEALTYLSEHPLDVFNYDFRDQYQDCTAEIIYDMKVNMFYCTHQGKRMYFKESYRTKDEVLRYYNSIRLEQDCSSPHRYQTKELQVEAGDIVVDAGVAEGNFALEVIDKASKIYLIEADEEWVKALKETFKPYGDKVIIVNKYISNFNNENHITIDHLLTSETINYIKMDIEGDEIIALEGAAEILTKNKDLKLELCAYHNKEDEKLIMDCLNKYNFLAEPSKGYMFFVNEAIYEDEEPRLVRGIIRGRKFK